MSDAGGTGRGGKTLVTGATGFIGGRLVSALLEAGHEVRALVRTPDLPPGLEDAELFRGDLLHPESLHGIEAGIDVAVHCASILGKWGTDESHLHDVNVNGTLNLLGRFENAGIRRFVHLSAGGVTGPVRQRAVDETYPCNPATAYERTKHLAELEVLEQSRRKGIPATVVRPTFTYGPGDPHKVALFRAVKKGRYVFIGDGESVNHPVFIDDLIRGILLAIDKGRTGEVYILGGERPVTKKELVYCIADALGVPRPRVRVPHWMAAAVAPILEMLGRAFGFEPILTRSRVMMMADNFGYSIDKARKELGYAPSTGLQDGIAATVRSFAESGEAVNKRVIINADDFGLSPGVNRGILDAFRNGVLTSTTMLVNLGFFDDAVATARDNPDLPVGIHLSLLWGPPVSDPAEVPTLIDRDGRFPRSLTTLARRYFTGRLSLDHVRTEFTRQIARFGGTGLVPTHVDTHKHVHCLPGVMDALIAAARESGIERARFPYEATVRLGSAKDDPPPRFSLAAKGKRNLIRFLCRNSRTRLREAGMRTTDHFVGIEQMAGLNSDVLRLILANLRPGVTEIMCHPGYVDDHLGEYSRVPPYREVELAGLKDRSVGETVASNDIGLMHFGDL